MAAYLNVLFGERNERLCCNDIMTVGRDAGNHIAISDPRISRNHAMIRCVGSEQFILFDIGSRNGCFINGSRIRSPTPLRTGDIISLGDAIITFEHIGSRRHLQPGNSRKGTETIAGNPSDIQDITVMVADIRDYTALSETLPIQVLSEVMVTWYDEVQRIVKSHGGRVDKFIGDCVMAVWEIGEDSDTRDVVSTTLRTTLAVCEFTGCLHERCTALPQPLLLGAGICAGQAAVGIGADKTAMGDTVNLAFRLEKATKTLKCDVVMNDRSYRSLPRWFWDSRQRSIQVKGKSAESDVCVLGLSHLRSFLQ